MRSDCRGVARKAPAPNRSRSNRDAPTAIISIAQHASPNVIGQSEFFLAQLMAKSSDVTISPSSKRFSIHDICEPLSPYYGDGCLRLKRGADSTQIRRNSG